MKKFKWSCEKTTRSYCSISKAEMNDRLVELWELLISSHGQLSLHSPLRSIPRPIFVIDANPSSLPGPCPERRTDHV